MHAYIHKHTHTHTHTHTHKRRQARPEVVTVRVPHYGHCVLIQNLPRARARAHTHTHTHTHKGAGHELNSIAHNPCGLWYKVACGQIPTHIAGHVPRPNDRGKRAEQAHVRCAHTPKIVVVVTPGRLRPRVCVCAVGEAVGEVGRQGQSESGGRARRGTRTVTTARNRRTQRHRECRRAASTGGVGWGQQKKANGQQCSRQARAAACTLTDSAALPAPASDRNVWRPCRVPAHGRGDPDPQCSRACSRVHAADGHQQSAHAAGGAHCGKCCARHAPGATRRCAGRAQAPARARCSRGRGQTHSLDAIARVRVRVRVEREPRDAADVRRAVVQHLPHRAQQLEHGSHAQLPDPLLA